MREYESVVAALRSGSVERLNELSHRIPGFPTGADPLLDQPWILAAVESGNAASVEWMLAHPMDLAYRGEDGYTAVHLTLESKGPDRLRILELLLDHGAPVNLKGINDWTPTHMAAAYDDVDALTLLVRHGADLSIRTEIDDYATPLEEARNLGKLKAVAYLESLG